MPRKQNITREIRNLTARLENTAKKARRAGDRRMLKGQQTIASIAQQYAPEDKGNLGDAIKTRESRGSRKVYEVYIDETAKGSNGAETVGEYAYMIHENSIRGKEYQLGQGSLDKDLEVGGNGLGWPRGGKVGPFFLTRAADKYLPKIENQVRDAIKRELK